MKTTVYPSVPLRALLFIHVAFDTLNFEYFYVFLSGLVGVSQK